MSANKKKQEEELNLKTLREIVALPHNKHCFDCNQRGPTYVNMTIGSFVCTACSGLLRGLNPPNRVKSISMASFNNDEMDFIKCRGNDLCRKVWLGLLDSRNLQTVDSKDESKMRDLMCQRYEKKRWYIHPNESLFEEARQQNQPNLKATTTTASASRTLSSLVNNLPPINVQQTSRSEASTTPLGFPIMQRPISHDVVASSPQSPTTLRSKQNNHMLADLGTDPFASTSSNNAAFADFSAFNSLDSSSIKQPGSGNNLAWSTNNAPLSLLQPMTSLSLHPPSASAPVSVAVSGPGDKYSALAGLDGLFTQPAGPLSSNSIDWNGSGKSSISAGGSVSWGGNMYSSQPSVYSTIPTTMPPPSYALSGQNPTYPGIPPSNPFAAASNPPPPINYPAQMQYPMPQYQMGAQYAPQPIVQASVNQFPQAAMNGGGWQHQMYVPNNSIRPGAPNPFLGNQMGSTGNANITNPFLQF